MRNFIGITKIYLHSSPNAAKNPERSQKLFILITSENLIVNHQ